MAFVITANPAKAKYCIQRFNTLVALRYIDLIISIK